ncbi:hypothetical protein [uncultured Vibrio sp.]|uniref:hypothetical protein n=1 Tax=uncultured Vibrio sp. TaxID=114054 RepID=UPI00262FEBF5|nr:hypothetical protein [uncultured Vibrio sp.]
MKKSILFTSLIVTATSLVSNMAFASSTIESSSGSSCEQTDFQPWEVSAGAGHGLYDNEYNRHDDWEDTDQNETQVGLKLTYRFGGAEQIDCGRFQNLVEREQQAYTTQLELKVQQLQAQLLKQERVNATKVRFK